MSASGQANRIAPAGEVSTAPQKLTGSYVAGAVYVPEDDEVYFLTPGQWRSANHEADAADESIRQFIEKVEQAGNDEIAKASLNQARVETGKKIKAMVDGVDPKKRLTEVHFLTSGRPNIAFVSQEQKSKWRAPFLPENQSTLSQRDKRTLERKGEKGLEKRLRYRERQAEQRSKLQEPQREKARQAKEKADRSWFTRDEDGKRKLKRDTASVKKKLAQAEIALKGEWRIDGQADLFKWKGSKTLEGKYYDVSASAQTMRYTAGVSAGLVFDPAKLAFKAKADAKASFAAAEGELTTAYYLPHRDGWSLDANRPGLKLHLCSLRFAAIVKLQGFVGASAAISAQLGIEPDPKTKKYVPIGIEHVPTDPNAEPTRDGGLLEVSAFAGAQASGSIGGALEWRSSATENQWKALAKCDYSIGAAAGIGFEGGFRVLYEQGKFIFYARLKVVLGVGLSGGMSYSVDARQIYQFIRFLYDELRRNDFGFVEWIAQEAFEHWSSIVYFAFIGSGTFAIEKIGESLSSIKEAWNQHSLEEEGARRMANAICRDSSLLTFATPETRGRMIYHLTNQGLWWNGDERRGAMIKIFETIQSMNDWNKTLRCVVPSKGQWLGPNGSQDQEVFAMSRISKLLDSWLDPATTQRFYAWRMKLPDTETHIRENIPKPPEKVNRWKITAP